jgi:D-alanyl-lipoteichoic acid acyltransferase DltB (MBOAT superfamily)
MWHGEAPNFILWGTYHGFGIAAVTIYQRAKRGVKSPHLQKYFYSRISTAVGTFLTFNFFALGLSLFVLDLEKFRILVSHIFSGI